MGAGGLRILASLIFFTRLPFWRIAEVPKEYYERVVPLWPLVGWLTGGIMAGVYYVCVMFAPIPVAVIAALLTRILITGALHEDGFADFCDGMGGGTTRERTLEIMKDSHIGTYGVLGLIIYYLLMYSVLCNLLPVLGCLVLLVGDTAGKMVSSSIVWFLPYARKESEAKNKLIYTHTSSKEKLLSILFGILPMLLAFVVMSSYLHYSWLPIAFTLALCATIAVAGILFRKMHNKIQGYTGDCCGATFIITEAIFYIILLLVTYYNLTN